MDSALALVNQINVGPSDGERPPLTTRKLESEHRRLRGCNVFHELWINRPAVMRIISFSWEDDSAPLRFMNPTSTSGRVSLTGRSA